jgi:hypothetical protein
MKPKKLTRKGHSNELDHPAGRQRYDRPTAYVPPRQVIGYSLHLFTGATGVKRSIDADVRQMPPREIIVEITNSIGTVAQMVDKYSVHGFRYVSRRGFEPANRGA